MLQRVFVNNLFKKIGQNYVLYTSKFLKTSKSGNFDFLKFVLYRPLKSKFPFELKNEENLFPKLVVRENFKL